MAAKHPKLQVEKRTVFGKKLKKLRREGIFPANMYGKGLESVAVQLGLKEFKALYKEVGETGLVEVELDGKTHPVLIHNVQIDYQTNTPVHADFFQVNLKEKVKTMVPLVVIGEPKAVTENIGLLLQPIFEVEVEALPADLPEHIEVNVEQLAAIDDQITVNQLKTPSEVAVLTDPEQIVVKISELVSKEAAEQAAQEEAASEAAKAEEAPVEEGEQPAETPVEKAPAAEEAKEEKAE